MTFPSKMWRERLKVFQSKHPQWYFLADLGLNIIVIVLLVYGVRTFIISPFQVFGPSMCDTLNYIDGKCRDGFGEYLIVNKAVYYPFFGNSYRKPERGDIVVFRPPGDEKEFYIKRIVGVPEEKIKIQNGRVFVYNEQYPNGYELPEPYLNEDNKNKTYAYPAHLAATYEVPKDNYFVLGDNRNRSTDSRMCFKGIGSSDCNEKNAHFLPFGLIEGKAEIVLWPFSKVRILEKPIY